MERRRSLLSRPFLREFHTPACTCSLCRELQYAGPHSFGFLAPLDKVWNAWRWLFLKTATGTQYLRWTGFWQRTPNRVGRS